MLHRAPCAFAAAALVAASLAAAPLMAAEPVSIVVGYTAGGTTDTIARVIAPRLSEKLGQTVIVEDKPGAAAQIGARYVAKAAPDGNTLLIATQTSHAAGQRLYPHVGYDPVKDFTPISLVAWTPLVLVAGKDFPVNSVQELIAYVKERPGQVSYATGGRGDGSHLAGLFLNSQAQIQAVDVPYQGDGAAMPAVLGGHVPYMFVSAPTAMSGISTGLIKPLAVSSKARFPGLPNVPTVSESGVPGFEMVNWWGFFGPAGMKPELVTKLNTAITELLKEPETRKRLNDLGYEITGTSPEEFADYVKAENVKWAQVIGSQGLAAK